MSSKDLLEKYEYLTGKDLGHKLCVFEKTNFEYSPLCMSLNRALKKDEVKVLLRTKIFNMMANTHFTDFTKGMMNLKRCH